MRWVPELWTTVQRFSHVDAQSGGNGNHCQKGVGLGLYFFDTANTYSHGTSEEYLGRAIKNSVSRDKVILATKVYFNEGHLSKKQFSVK